MSTKTGPFKIKPILIVLLLATALSLLTYQPVTAQSSRLNQVSVLFVLDDSGSMAGNDQENLRYTAAKLFISALDEGDAVGAIRFSTTSQPITRQMVSLESPDTKKDLMNALQPPVRADGYTDVKKAFEDVQNMLADSRDAEHETIIVFLTDGKPEIPQPYAAYEDETLALIKSINVPVYAIALTHEGQSAFLNKVTEQTSGKVILAKSGNDLLDSYLQILGDLKDRTVVGEGSVQAPCEVPLDLDPGLIPYVNQVTFIVSKQDGVFPHLIAPDNREVKASDPFVSFAMLSDPKFAAYTVTTPASGAWKFNLGGSGSAQVRAILHSRLRAKIVSPGSMIEAGQKMSIVVNLIEEQVDQTVVKVVGEASFSALITLPDGTRQSLDRFYDDGTYGDRVAGDGNFTRDFMDATQSGTYLINLNGYKGVVPVTVMTQVEAIPFPKETINQPANPKYEVRSNVTVPLQVHLEEPDTQSAFEGDFKARITSPTGQVIDIPLSLEHDVFNGQFTPNESGLYTVTFQPVNAFYQGLPYQTEIKTDFESVLFSQLAVQAVRLGLENGGSQEKLELQQAIEGIPLVVEIKSNSSRLEELTAGVDHMPGFSLVESDPLKITPSGVTTFTLHLKGDAKLSAGKVEGFLTFSPSGAVDISNNQVPLHFEVFIPQITFSAEVVSHNSENVCWQWAPVKLILRSVSTSPVVEKIHVQLESVFGGSLSPDNIEVKPGNGEIELDVIPSGQLTAGNYEGSISFTQQRSGVKILPALPLPLSFDVEPIWISCRSPMILLGLGVLVAIMVIVMVIMKVKSDTTAAIVTGTLIHWNKDLPDMTTNVDLTAVKKSELRIGKSDSNEVVIPDETVDELHAVIIAERVEDEVRLVLQPRSKVRKGYREYSDAMPLEENVTYQMGNRMFKYIRDL